MKIFILGTILFLAGCAHHNDVRRGTDGVHVALVKTKEPREGFEDAAKQAAHFCGQMDKKSVTIEKTKKFLGEGGEDRYIANQRAVKANTYLTGMNFEGLTDAEIEITHKFKCE